MFREKIRTKLAALAPTGTVFTVSAGEKNFGDYASNLAMVWGKQTGQNPHVVGEELVAKLNSDSECQSWLEKIELAGPGFLNFYLKSSALSEALGETLKQAENFGKPVSPQKSSINIEFVSANPTGPLTLGNGRSAAYGEALANLFKFFGNTVEKEYFLNDIGRQVRILGESVARKFVEISGGKIDWPADTKVLAGKPDEMYQGEYINDLAEEFKTAGGYTGSLDDLPAIAESAGAFAMPKMIEAIKQSLARFGVVHDVWFQESSLQNSGEIKAVLETLAEKNLSYEQEGALWFKATQFGLDKDIVIRKSDGFTAYILSDFAYAINKVQRGYNLMIYILGADHHGDVARIKTGLRALGLPEDKFHLMIYQVVTFLDKGEKFKMSKRAGKFITLDSLLDEVPADVVKFFFLMKSMDSQMDFDFSLAKEESNKNPVFYIQYAFVRMSKILQQAQAQNLVGEAGEAMPDWQAEERALATEILRWPEILADTVADWQVHRIATYLLDLAGVVSRFYEACRVIGGEAERLPLRLTLVQGSVIVLKSGLGILGLTAPEQM